MVLDLSKTRVGVVCHELQGLGAAAQLNLKRRGQTALSFDRARVTEVYNGDLDQAAKGVQAVMESAGLSWVGDEVFAHIGASRIYTNVQSQDAEASVSEAGAAMSQVLRARQIAAMAARAAQIGAELTVITTEITVRI